MKREPSNRNELSAQEKTEIMLDTVNDVLRKVIQRYEGTDRVADIRAALDNLHANKQDVKALGKALSYCSGDWIFGPVN